MQSEDKLKEFLQQHTANGIALAFSGGVDSTLLLAILAEMRQKKHFPLIALTMHSSFQQESELADIQVAADHYQVPLQIFRGDPMTIPEVRANQPDRCYWCKRFIFREFQKFASDNGFAALLDGTHAGDLHTYRPGRKALAELGVISPLAEIGMDKPEIRLLAGKMGLAVSRKPAAPCLATRFAYGTDLTPEMLAQVASGEAFLRQFLPETAPLRLRFQGDLARIEVPPETMPVILDRREEIIGKLRSLGFHFITLDLQGFRSGSYDHTFKP